MCGGKDDRLLGRRGERGRLSAREGWREVKCKGGRGLTGRGGRPLVRGRERSQMCTEEGKV